MYPTFPLILSGFDVAMLLVLLNPPWMPSNVLIIINYYLETFLFLNISSEMLYPFLNAVDNCFSDKLNMLPVPPTGWTVCVQPWLIELSVSGCKCHSNISPPQTWLEFKWRVWSKWLRCSACCTCLDSLGYYNVHNYGGVNTFFCYFLFISLSRFGNYSIVRSLCHAI